MAGGSRSYYMARPIKYTPDIISDLTFFAMRHHISMKSACAHKKYSYVSFIRAKNKFNKEGWVNVATK